MNLREIIRYDAGAALAVLVGVAGFGLFFFICGRGVGKKEDDDKVWGKLMDMTLGNLIKIGTYIITHHFVMIAMMAIVFVFGQWSYGFWLATKIRLAEWYGLAQEHWIISSLAGIVTLVLVFLIALLIGRVVGPDDGWWARNVTPWKDELLASWKKALKGKWGGAFVRATFIVTFYILGFRWDQ